MSEKSGEGLGPRPKRVPSKAIKAVEKALEEIKKLHPTPQEIEAFGNQAGYGVVTYTRSLAYFPPRLHNTWGEKWGGRVHIDIGSDGTHLMLDRYEAWRFVEFIRDRRAPK